MTKHWIMFALSAIGLVVIALWTYRKLTNKSVPPVGREVVSVSTDDPNMIIPDFSGKIDWHLEDPEQWRKLVTTYAVKQ